MSSCLPAGEGGSRAILKTFIPFAAEQGSMPQEGHKVEKLCEWQDVKTDHRHRMKGCGLDSAAGF
jgi:hypothetical protein